MSDERRSGDAAGRQGPWRRLVESRPGRTLARGLSRIWIRLLAFNVLLLFLPAAGLLVLDTFETQLLDAQERAMVQQGRLLAAALSGRGPLTADADRAPDTAAPADAGSGGTEDRAAPATEAERSAEHILRELNRRLEARLRVVDANGRVIADSAALGPRREPGEERAVAGGGPSAPRDSLLYRLGSNLHRLWRTLSPAPDLPPARPGLYTTGDDGRLSGPAVGEALAGRYGADLRVTAGEEGSVTTLHSAIPVTGAEAGSGPVVGAVLVSQSTSRVLAALTELRLGLFQVILASVAAAVVLSLLVATTIARPLARLRSEARAIVDRRGRLTGSFGGSNKHDEIGELARALERLTRRLRRHLGATEAFASDVSHEFKNPLASIRSATEMLTEAESDEERQRFQAIVLREVNRLERLLTSVREISAIDAGLDREEAEPVLLGDLLRSVVEGYRLRDGSTEVDLELPEEPLAVHAAPERLAQVAENLLDNAASFSPEGAAVRLRLERDGDRARLAVEDSGPGIPEEHLERLFDRFFSYRSEAPRHDRTAHRRDGHAGLGLAIVRAIAEGYGGGVRAANRPGGGARFEVTFPLADRRW